METNCFRGDHVHQRSALDTGKHSGIDLFCESFFAYDDAAAGPAQTFVGGGGDELRVGDGAGMLTSCNEPGNVRHVDEKNGAD